MKKILALLLSIALMLLLFVGCDVNPEKEILGFWKGNPEVVDGVPLGSDMVIEFRNNGTGCKYTQQGVNEIETPFTYTIKDGYLNISIYDADTFSLKLDFEKDKMILVDEALKATEEYLRIESKEDK